ncbi:MAG: hypothetical protein KJO91_11800, partial [Gammaproteobacteria bacterium]|nr:hypothetical protein [Gammaproteobacteria bacterium]
DIASKRGKKSALFITNFLVAKDSVLLNSIKESVNFIYGYCEVGKLDTVRSLIDGVSDNIDFIFLHGDLYKKMDIRRSNTLVFDDRKCWFDSVNSLVQILLSRHRIERVLLAGDSWLLYKVIDGLGGYALKLEILDSSLTEKGRNLIQAKQDLEKIQDISFVSDAGITDCKYDLVISTSVKKEVINGERAEKLNYNLVAIDAGIGGFSREFVTQLYENDSDVYRVDNRSALSALMLSAVENIDLVDNVKGELNYKGIRVVAGGEMGFQGDVIVDNVSTPSCVIGIADGAGKTLYPPYNEETLERIDVIEELIET